MILNRRQQIIAVVLLCLITAGVFARAAFFPFNILDDGVYVTRNPNVMQGLSLDTVKWAFGSVYQYNWIPLTWLSFALESCFFGTNPLGYHVVNVVLHVVNVWLLWYLLQRVTGQFWKSLLVAALFALHPLRVESVAWIAERKDVLSTLFWMLTMIGYCSYAREQRRAAYVLSLAAFTLGLLSKQMLVTVPAVLLLLDFWPLRRLGPDGGVPLKKLLLEKVPFAALSLAATAAVFYANKISGSLKSTELVPLGERVTTALWHFFFYLYKTALPVNLSIVYPTTPEPAWKGLCAGILIAAVLFAAWRARRSRPYLACGFLFYLVTVLPVSGLVQVGTVSVADRFVYVPLIGIFIIVSWGMEDLAVRWPRLRAALPTAAGVVLAACMVLTWSYLAQWKDNVTLLRHAVAVTGENHVAHENLGLAYAGEGRYDQALEEFRRAEPIGPPCPELHVCMGNTLDEMGRVEEAAVQYALATRLSPGKVTGHLLYARVLQRLGRPGEAIAEYGMAIQLEPRNALLHDNIGLAYLQAGQIDQAIEHLSAALDLNPSLRQTRSTLDYALSLRSSRR